MVLELATILLGVTVGAIAVLYAAPRGYLGRSKKAKLAAAPTTSSTPSVDTYAPTTEQAPEVPAAETPAVAEPAPSPAPEPEAAPAPAPALYESVQPAPAPVTFAAPTSSSFAAPTLTKKPTRTYRRRTAPVRGAAGTRKTLKPKKR